MEAIKALLRQVLRSSKVEVTARIQWGWDKHHYYHYSTINYTQVGSNMHKTIARWS